MKFVALAILLIYGALSRFTNSEFWPITISKTWLTPSEFELSMVQKPLLTLLLSVFHLLPLSDEWHLITVKTVFSLIGVAGIYLYTTFICKRFFSDTKINQTFLFIAVLLSSLILSPNFQNHFFSVRSDQLAFTLFALFLVLCESQKPTAALITLFLIPAAGVKESFFLLPGLIYFFAGRKITIDRRKLFFIAYGGFAAVIWIVALNIPYFHYFTDLYHTDDFSLIRNLKSPAVQSELPALIMATLANVYILLTRQRADYPSAFASLFLTSVILVNPQPYFFFLAGICPFIYLSLWTIGPSLFRSIKVFYLSIAAVGIISVGFRIHLLLPFFEPLTPQLKFVSKVSKTIEENNFSYLDGCGILPRQKFIPCFASPGDGAANESCLASIAASQADTVIITNRLNFIGARVFSALPKDYEQIYPNTWIRSQKLTAEIKKNADLSSDVGIPILIF